MTFDEYNTDEYFNNDNSTADGLVKAGYDEGKTRKEIEDSLSPLWKEDKKGNVKKALDTYYKTETAPKSEEKKEEVKETVKTETPKTTEESTGIKQSDRSYMNDINAILNEEQKQELQKLSKTSVDAYNKTMDNIQRSGEAFKTIDDHLIDQLPTFLFKRYSNGEFGDPKSSDAKLRLAYFVMNGLKTQMQRISNGAAIAAGKAPLYQGVQSAYEQYQNTNLEEGMANRWNKYKQDTQAAIDLVKQRNINEEDALNIINKISMNNRLQNAYNMADANKKAYMIEVLSKIGDKVSNWNDTKFVNALIGAEMTGEDIGNAAALIGTRAGVKILDNFNLFDENGNLNLSALKNIKDLPGIKEAFSKFGIDLDNVDFETAGIGGSGDSDTSTGDEVYDTKATGNKWKNPTGNLRGYKSLDGKVYDFSTFATKEEKDNLAKISKELSDAYYYGKIDAKTYHKYLDPIVNEAKKHTGINVTDTDTMLRKNISKKLEDLNKATKNGTVTVDSYKDQTAKILAMAEDAGYTEKEITKLKKDFKDTSKIKYKGPSK